MGHKLAIPQDEAWLYRDYETTRLGAWRYWVYSTICMNPWCKTKFSLNLQNTCEILAGPWVSNKTTTGPGSSLPSQFSRDGSSRLSKWPCLNNKAERVTEETLGFHLQFPCVYTCVYNKHLPTQRDSEICHCVQRTTVNHYSAQAGLDLNHNEMEVFEVLLVHSTLSSQILLVLPSAEL